MSSLVFAGYTWQSVSLIPAAGTRLTKFQAAADFHSPLCLLNNCCNHMVCVSVPHRSTIDFLSVTPVLTCFKDIEGSSPGERESVFPLLVRMIFADHTKGRLVRWVVLIRAWMQAGVE